MQLDKKAEIKLDAKGKKVGVVVSRFNQDITEKLLASAKEKIAAAGVLDEDCHCLSVAGAMEIPYALKKMAETGKYDCLVAVGCVIKGETPHFDYVCKMAQEGVLEVSLDHAIPIGFGVITVNTVEQAKDRFHVAGEAVLAALELALAKF